MQEELEKKMKEAAIQINEVKRYAKSYQKEFKRQADAYITDMEKDTYLDMLQIEQELEVSNKKMEKLKKLIENDSLQDVLDKLKSEEGE